MTKTSLLFLQPSSPQTHNRPWPLSSFFHLNSTPLSPLPVCQDLLGAHLTDLSPVLNTVPLLSSSSSSPRDHDNGRSDPAPLPESCRCRSQTEPDRHGPLWKESGHTTGRSHKICSEEKVLKSPLRTQKGLELFLVNSLTHLPLFVISRGSSYWLRIVSCISTMMKLS